MTFIYKYKIIWILGIIVLSMYLAYHYTTWPILAFAMGLPLAIPSIILFLLFDYFLWGKKIKNNILLGLGRVTFIALITNLVYFANELLFFETGVAHTFLDTHPVFN
ncbi:hypothetical protein AAG747_25170 [Rapidithrix thailandica]|uniref:Uncharacterized protein n=1 Tax=Rapidithrix thailandica TaxID=413964 RepID=A0AAW9S222_9BACT